MAVCDKCGKQFNSISALNQHQREQHLSFIQTVKCNFCQRPFLRISNLQRHLCSVHRLTMEKAKAELTHCERTRMSRDTFIDSQKAVYVTVMDDQYSDISSDEEEFENMIVDDPRPEESDEIPSVDSSVLEDMMRDEPVVTTFLDDILSDVDFEEDGSRGVNIEDDSTPIESEDTLSDMDSSTSVEYSSTTVITLTMIKTETVHCDGTRDVVRNTAISHSTNVDPNNLNFADIAMEVINEVPHHFHNRHVRVVTTADL